MRYARLYLYFLRFSFSKALQFRLDFFFRVVMDALWYGVNLAFFAVLYRHTGMLGGWTEDQALVFVAGVFVADAINMTVFSNNLWWFPIYVNRGDLDYHLVRPVSSLFMLSLREFAANSFLNLLMALGVLAWALMRYPEPLPLAWFLLYAALLLAGAFLHYVLHMLFLVPVFWLHSAHGLREVFFSLDQFSGRPHGIYTGWGRRILLTVLPFALVVSVPSTVLFEGPRASVVLHVLAVDVALFFALQALWRRGLRAYASASS